MPLAGGAIASLFNGRKIILVFFVVDIDNAVVGEKMAMAGITAWHNAIEHINTAPNRFDNVGWGANTHKITGLIFWHIFFNVIDYIVHNVGAFANCQATDSIALKVEFGNILHIFNSQISINAALVDTEKLSLSSAGVSLNISAPEFLKADKSTAFNDLQPSNALLPIE